MIPQNNKAKKTLELTMPWSSPQLFKAVKYQDLILLLLKFIVLTPKPLISGGVRVAKKQVTSEVRLHDDKTLSAG